MRYPRTLLKLLLLPCLLWLPVAVTGQVTAFLQLPCMGDDDRPYMTLQAEMDHNTTADVRIICRQVRAKDSVIVYDLLFTNIPFAKGVSSRNLVFGKAEAGYTNPVTLSFQRAMERLGGIPAGVYSTSLDITGKDSVVLQKRFYNAVDSDLTLKNGLTEKLNGVFSSAQQPKASDLLSKHHKEKQFSRDELDKTSKRLSRKLGRASGIDLHPVLIAGKSYTELYAEGWYLGRYALLDTRAMQARIAGEATALKDNATSFVTTSLEEFQGVSSQLKELYRQSKKKEEGVQGNLEIAEYLGNGQEPGAAQDNNYTELRGDVQTKIFDMPVGIEGYYTAQDRHRQAKASYIRLHYDVEEAKSALLKQVNGYKSKFNEAVAKGQGLEQVYGTYLSNLGNEKNSMLQEMSSKYGISENTLQQYNGDLDKILAQNAIDTAKLIRKAESLAEKQINNDSVASLRDNKLAKAKTEIAKDKEKIKKQYERLVKLEQTYERYKTLLNQYREQLHMDSALVYNKLEALSKDKDASYKDMLKAASGLLPEGKVKQFASGLTNFDAGIINQYTSAYTMAGQNLKGLSAGYDFGIVQAGVTVGKTEYVSRDGSVDKYNTWLGRVGFKPAKCHNLELIYYGYSPAVKALENDNFYQHTDKAPDGFKAPVTIVSLNYDGQFGKSLLAHAEGATSFKKGQNTQLSPDNSAVKASVDYLIPKTTANVKAEWEHLGNDFQNNALPYTKAGTERYTLAATTNLFHSFLTVGVQYNYLQQESFSSAARSIKWGFDIKTHSKRYPGVQLSYKPFSTFRAFNDTFSIPQRPVTGEVWTGRASYQLKRHKVIHRFTLVYNQNTGNMDTLNYSSRMMQAGYSYSKGNNGYSINAGWQSLPVVANTDGTYSNSSTWFAGTVVSKSLTRQLNGTIGQDIAWAKYGIQRIATTAGLNYRMEKQPLTLRLQVWYTNYKATETADRKNLYAGMIGAAWRFKTGMKH